MGGKIIQVAVYVVQISGAGPFPQEFQSIGRTPTTWICSSLERSYKFGTHTFHTLIVRLPRSKRAGYLVNFHSKL